MTLKEFETYLTTYYKNNPLFSETDIFFRFGDKDENLLETCSVEVSEDRGLTIDNILDIYNYETLDELKDDIDNYNPARPEMFESNLSWDDNGHLGAGLYYNGVCCETSLSALADYVNSRHWGNENSVVYIFAGYYNGDCNDGEVAIPKKELLTIPRAVLENEEVVEAIDDICENIG